MKRIYTCIILIALFSCQTRNEALETALKLAGDNRGELEKVLDHYSRNPADSLKLQAAEFLIANMPGHYTLQGNLINEYRAKIDADDTTSYFAKKALDISLSQIDQIRQVSHKEEDVEHVKADFLIRHVDASFERLYKYPWLKDIPFDLFLEYILPYRFENERLDLWIDSVLISDDDLQLVKCQDDTKHLVTKLSAYSFPSLSLNNASRQLVHEIFHQNIYLDCYHSALKENLSYHLPSLPCAIDCIPHYANRNGYHYWITMLSPESKNTEVRGTTDRKATKIYRKTYSRNKIPLSEKGEYIPDFFLNPFFKDVSDQYMHTSDATVLPAEQSSKQPFHAYLCVFNNLSWLPVAIEKFQESKIKFKNIGKNLVYLPVYYRGKKMSTLNYPFVFTLKGETKYLIPDTNQRQKIIIKRKYPFTKDLYFYNQNSKNIIIEASNSNDFQISDTLLSTLSPLYITHARGQIETDKKFRYWRISSPCFIYIAELSFLDSQGKTLKAQTDTPKDSLAFDNNPLTYASLDHDKQMIIDFNTPTHVSKIICLPQSDGNGIYPGDDYELFYHDLNGWKSLGRQIATDYILEYNNVPRGALLWLHNHTTGIEERIFTYENGEIRFW
ncbi:MULTISPECIES: hypothetical protein [Butyricimonas]|uniref:hypothetical protein n=1 Tax=Butyricimonas TaxID=574697 RepID=UPI0007FB2324|nr:MULTISPECIES: hypothetical protein [Butyricimonas]